VAYALSDDIKIIDLKWPWRSQTTSTVGYSSDSWASCFLHSLGGITILGRCLRSLTAL